MAHEKIVPKVKILLSYGEHAREFLPVESLFHLLNNITDGLRAPVHSPAYKFTNLILSRVSAIILSNICLFFRVFAVLLQEWFETCTLIKICSILLFPVLFVHSIRFLVHLFSFLLSTCHAQFSFIFIQCCHAFIPLVLSITFLSNHYYYANINTVIGKIVM